MCDWTGLWVRDALIESLPLHFWQGSSYLNVAVCLVIGRSASHFQSPFSPSVLAAPCMCEEAEGLRNWGRNESRPFEVLFSSQAKQQAYSYPPERWKSPAFD